MINLKKKIVAVVTTMTVAAWMIPGSAFAVTAEELQAQINSLLATLTALQSQLATLEGGTTGGAITGVPAGFTFDANLKQGDSGDAVKYMQIVLNSDSATQVAASGVGSSGNETMYFGPLTKTAVVKFQEKYASEVLATYGLTAGTGFVGSTTRAKLNGLLGGGAVTPITPITPITPVVPATGNASVSLAADTPADKQVALAAIDSIAAKFKFYGGADGATISKVVLKRGGVSADADVSAIKLYDGTTQLGSSQALNTNTHKATFSALNWNIPAGETKYLTIKVSVAAKGTATVGDSIKLIIDSASDITSTAALDGTFPLSGNALTIAGISVGELFVAEQATPATTTILSGATEQEIASWQFTASSTEGVSIESITITHVGSASAGDLSNFKLKYAGEQLGSTIAALNAENKVTFDLSAAPLDLLSGASKTVYAYADIKEGISTSRTVQFEITQYTEITVYGTNSGGAIEAANSDTVSFSKQKGSTMTIGQGTLTVNIDAAYNPAVQTYVKGSTNRLFSAFKFTTGSREGVRIVKFKLKLNNGTGAATDISNITLWDGTTQIAGPVSLIGSYATFGSNTVGWDDPGLFDIAKSSNKTITVKADIPTGATANNTVDLDIAATSDIWIDGLTSQYDINQSEITLTSGNANRHTVGANGTLTATLSSNTPSAQTYIKGGSGVEMLRFNLTADSGEDISVTSITIDLKSAGANAASGDYTNVKLLKLDGTQLGSTVSSPSNEAAFSINLTVPASGTVILKVIADIPSTTALVTGNFQLTNNADITSTGVSSSATLTETVSSVTGNTMTIGEGSLTVSAAAIPGDQTAIVGSTKVPIVGLVFTAGSAENVRVTYVKLTATGATTTDICGTATANTACYGDQDDLENIALYDGDTRLTTLNDWDSTTATTVTFDASDFLNASGFDITKGSQKTITVRADISSTATNNHRIALGISSSSDAAQQTKNIVFTGLDSNTNPTTSLSFSSAIGGINFSTSSAPAALNYVTIASKGTLTVAAAADTPDSDIVAVGTTGAVKQDVVFTKFNLTSSREDIDIKSIIIDRGGTALAADTDFEDISLWDGTTQLGVDQVLVNTGIAWSSTSFSFPAGSYWRLPKDVTKTLTVKADLQGVKSADQGGTTSGDSPYLCLSPAGDNSNYGIEGLGVGSGATIHASGTAPLCGNWMVFHKSKLSVAASSLPNTVLDASTKTLYRWTVTAGSDGDIGWKRVIFDVSGSIQIGSDTYTVGYGAIANANANNTSSAILIGTTTTGITGNTPGKRLIATSTMHVYNVATGVEINASTSAAGFYVENYTADGGARLGFLADSEQVVPAGTTKTYELKGDVAYAGKAGDSLSFKIAKRVTATSTDTFVNVVGGGWGHGNTQMYVTSTAPTFIWSDRSGVGSTHSMTTGDWSQEYKISGIPTATLSLSK